MANLIPLSFDSHQIRVITLDDGDPMFAASDVAKALGYARPKDAVSEKPALC